MNVQLFNNDLLVYADIVSNYKLMIPERLTNMLI